MHLEKPVTIILAIIIVFFVFGFVGILNLSSFPVIGGFFPRPYSNVLIVGEGSQNLIGLLQAGDYQISGIKYIGQVAAELVVPGSLYSRVDIVILQGVKKCDSLSSETIGEWVKEGGRLIIVADACSEGQLWEISPVTYEKTFTIQPGTNFRITQADHYMFNGIRNFNIEGITAAQSSIKPQATLLAQLKSSDSETVGMAQNQYGQGEVTYIAFDPSESSRNMFLNLLSKG